MQEIKTKKVTTMSGRLETGVEVKVEVKEECHAVMDGTNSDGTGNEDNITAILPDNPYKTVADIAEKIDYCLRIVVKQTDTLPKQVCRSCLEELELCYQFNKTVEDAEKQLLAVNRRTSGQFVETDRNCHTSSLCNVHCVATGLHNIDRTLQASPGIEVTDKKSLTVESSMVSTSSTPSLVSVPTESHCTNNIDKGGGISSYSEHRSIDPSMDVPYSGWTLTSDRDLHSICDSEVPEATHSRSQTGNKKASSSRREEGLEDQGDVIVHEEAYTGETLYRCNLCAKTFKTFNSRRTHDKLHTGKGLHSCEYCEKKFTSRADKIRHHRIHTGERPFKCSVCEMTFIESTKLRRHAAVHSEKRNYPCSLCDKSFKHMSSRKLHMEVHAGEMTWQCEYCKKYYKRKQVLGRHVKTCNEGYQTNSHYMCKDPFQIDRIQDFLIGNK